ncbi:MAG: hypothetical protein LBH28_08770 [Oscillospiraceae bacterium]|jgi:FtsZ-binding cell division protein ZapB|nr:hypothetical protein [Oscillospiraceae bacterium]
MANFDELKRKAKDAITTIADVSVEAYKIAEEKAKIVARKAKLNAEIAREKSLIRRRKYDIGKAYYELYKDDPGEAFKENCDDITSALERIAARQKEIQDLKNNGLRDDEDDFCECDCCDEESDPDNCEPEADAQEADEQAQQSDEGASE